jgi:glycerol-3-phosphate O-acyltransferase/dihydroxyacetone phosphate acyltransferase
MSEYNTKNVKIVHVGLNYFNRDKFRSEVIIEFSKPYEVPSELAIMYKTDKKKATEILLSEIESRMKAVTLTAPSYKELRSILFIRKLYAPPDMKLSPNAYSILCRRFSKAYYQLKELPEAQNLMNEITKYIEVLENTGLMDHEVRCLDYSYGMMIRKYIFSMIMLILLLIFILPGILIAYPFVIYLRWKAEKERLLVIFINFFFLFFFLLFRRRQKILIKLKLMM